MSLGHWFLLSYSQKLSFVQVREIYGLDEKTVFRNVTVSLEGRPQPLYLGTATQIGMQHLSWVLLIFLKEPSKVEESNI